MGNPLDGGRCAPGKKKKARDMYLVWRPDQDARLMRLTVCLCFNNILVLCFRGGGRLYLSQISSHSRHTACVVLGQL